MILSDLAKYSVTWSAARSFCDSWASCANKQKTKLQTNKQIYKHRQSESNSEMKSRVEEIVLHVLCVLVLCIQVSHLAVWGSIASWFLFLAIYPYMWPNVDLAPEMVGMVCRYCHLLLKFVCSLLVTIIFHMPCYYYCYWYSERTGLIVCLFVKYRAIKRLISWIALITR